MLPKWCLTSARRYFVLFGLSSLLWDSYLATEVPSAYYPLVGDQVASSVKVCTTDLCTQTAYFLRNLIDENVEPCQDFYSFACGSFIRKYKPLLRPDTPVMSPLESTIITMKNTIIEKLMKTEPEAPEVVRRAKHFFVSCIHENELKHLNFLPLDTLLKTIGFESQPSFVNDDWKPIDLSATIAKTRQQFDINFPFRLTVERDPMNKSKSRLELKIPLPDINSKVRQHVRKLGTRENHRPFGANKCACSDRLTGKTDDAIQEYVPLMNYMVKVAFEMYVQTHDPDVYKPELMIAIRREMAEIAYLMHQVEKLTRSINLRKLAGQKFTISELQQLTDSISAKKIANRLIDWSSLIQQLLTYSSREGQIANVDKIYVEDVNYFKRLIRLMSYSSAKTLVGAMWWHTVRSHILDLHSDMRALEEEYRAEVGLKVLTRVEYCVDSTIELFGYATVHSYMIDDSIQASFKNFLNKLPKNLSDVFEGIIRDHNWLRMKTIMGALKKLKSTYITLGYPTEFENHAEIQAAYQHVILHENNYFITRFYYNFSKIRQQLKTIGGPIMRRYPHPLEKKIIFDPQTNEIFVPLALLHFPMLLDGLNSLLIGTLTSGIIHAMFYSFDAKGAEWNLWGVHSNWWSKKGKAEYSRRADCFVQFYRQQCFPEVHKCVDGEATVNETVTENGAFKAALEMFGKIRYIHGDDPKLVKFERYTPYQLLTLAYAVQLCQVQTNDKLIEELESSDSPPASVLVNGTLMNSDEFQEIWECEKRLE